MLIEIIEYKTLRTFDKTEITAQIAWMTVCILSLKEGIYWAIANDFSIMKGLPSRDFSPIARKHDARLQTVMARYKLSSKQVESHGELVPFKPFHKAINENYIERLFSHLNQLNLLEQSKDLSTCSVSQLLMTTTSLLNWLFISY